MIKLSRMCVFFVAVAAAREADLSELLVGVALGALHRSVHTTERIPCSVVIEVADGPRTGIVASPTIGSELPQVRITVAVGTLSETDTFPLLCRMTFDAIDSSVRAEQWESRSIMIEADSPELDIEGVTLLAILTELFSVNIFVARDAGGVVQEKSLGLLSWR